MSNPVAITGSALVRQRATGVAFLAVISALVWLSVLLYQKAFTNVVDVTLDTDHIGNQLSVQADVKLRGLVVGRVTSVHTRGDGATIGLALNPGEIKQIPSNVVAQLLPKTLFGEKYVELITPERPAKTYLRNGDVIPQDRSSTALETERAINDLLPLLQSLKPQDLSITLRALSAALRDRGNQVGATFANAGAYLKKLNPSVPTLGADLAGLADFTNNVANASPDVLKVLDNLSASSRNLVQEKGSLDTFLTTTSSFAATAQSIVAENQAHLTSLAVDAVPVTSLFARYSPEFPCWLKGFTVYEPILEKAFGGGQPGLHITVELTQDNGGYAVGQEPKYRDKRAPACWNLPHPHVPEGDDKFDDGYRTTTTPSYGLVSSNPALAEVAAPAMGVAVNQVPDVVGLLLGPVAQGNAVGLA